MGKIIDVWYCKARKKFGDPITVRTWNNGKAEIKSTNEWELDLYDSNHNKVKIRIKFNNTTGKAKASGATAMLEILTAE